MHIDLHHSSILARAACIAAALALPGVVAAQQPVTRDAAVESALTHGAAVAVARATAMSARAQLRTARAYPNPAVTASYSKDVPQYHAALDIPLELPWLRGARVGAAVAADTSAQYTFAFARASVRYDVDTAYTNALASAAHARLSRRNAQDADSLLRMATTRRDAGDASELDVQLATVNAGQLANIAAADSLDAIGDLLVLQRLMGLAADTVTIALADSLMPPTITDPPRDSGDPASPDAPTLQVAAASAALRSAEQNLALERHNVWSTPSIQVGFDAHDPSGAETGLLPTVGLSLPLPLFNRNGGPVDAAAAERDRARAELTLAKQESDASIAQALRERAVALRKTTRDEELLASAQRVAAMSLEAYREGAIPLASVLEAERNARDVQAQYIDDVAAANSAHAAVQLFTLTTGRP
ncbi:MAG TPA: TolC family protein [Gemmatimonadaceae bacterium]|nr:TolC family protein [Gemmatimonadaceae bacterium]